MYLPRLRAVHVRPRSSTGFTGFGVVLIGIWLIREVLSAVDLGEIPGPKE